MPVSQDQLRQLLAERSEPARSRPVPQERIAARIRRARMKRAAGAGLLAIAVAAGVVSGVHLAHERTSVTSYSGPPLAASFTASDGAAYHQLAVMTVTEPDPGNTTLTLHVGSDPVDVMAGCDRPRDHILLGVKVNGAVAGFLECQPAPQLLGLPVRPGQVAHITFVPASGLGLPDMKATWRVAAYTWTPAAQPRHAPAAPRLPSSYTGPNTTTGHGNALRKLIASRSGTWPADRTATFTLTYRGGHSLDIATICAGVIGSRLQVSHQIDGTSRSEADPCTPAGPGDLETGVGSVSGVNGQPITLTFHIQPPGSSFAADYAKRPASWTIAIYEEQT